MRLLTSLLLLACLATAICVPLWVGHGILRHDVKIILMGLGWGIVSAILIAIYLRVAPADHAPHHH